LEVTATILPLQILSGLILIKNEDCFGICFTTCIYDKISCELQKKAIISCDAVKRAVNINTVTVTSFAERREKEKRAGFDSTDQFATVIFST
jgi:hypothetical protein